MRRVRTCEACGKPLTIASSKCLWCGQPKRLFSRRIVAGLMAGLSFVAGVLAVLRLRTKSGYSKAAHEPPAEAHAESEQK